MFTPPASPTPSRIIPLKDSRRASDDDTARLLFRDAAASPFPVPSSSSALLASSSASASSSTSLLFQSDLSLSANPSHDSRNDKKRLGRRTTWTIVVVPLVLLVITLSTRYVSHPAAFDVFSPDRAVSWNDVTDWQPHKRHPNPATSQSSSGDVIAFPTPTPTSSSPSSSSASPSIPIASQPIPTVPSSPPTLPTPFPQPLDTTLSLNFSTQGCSDFFTNMTQTEPFRECRPFSLLQRTSSAFMQQAQTNLSALNAIVWGTCNTDVDEATCDANMAWFTTTLKTACATELGANNAMVVETLTGLEAYPLLRDTACITDQQTSSYCYVEAVRNTNPSDLYFYELPLGTALPPDTNPSCSACTQSVMRLYAQATTGNGSVAALAGTYSGAAQIANAACGAGYVQTTSSEDTGDGVKMKAGVAWVVVVVGSVMAAIW